MKEEKYIGGNKTYGRLQFLYTDGTFPKDGGKTIANLKTFLQGDISILDFNKIIPQPSFAIGIDLVKISMDEANANNEYWGCRSNTVEARISKFDNTHLTIDFATQLAPPKLILIELSKLFPNILITYVGVDNGGYHAYHFTYDPDNASCPIKEIIWKSGKDEDNNTIDALRDALGAV